LETILGRCHVPGLVHGGVNISEQMKNLSGHGVCASWVISII
jgi:hypothetical protein